MSADPGQTMMIYARDVTRGRFDPDAYPHRHLAVVEVAKDPPPAAPRESARTHRRQG